MLRYFTLTIPKQRGFPIMTQKLLCLSAAVLFAFAVMNVVCAEETKVAAGGCPCAKVATSGCVKPCFPVAYCVPCVPVVYPCYYPVAVPVVRPVVYYPYYYPAYFGYYPPVRRCCW